MDPQEPAKNDEGSGFSKRRISSILKMPRKSARISDSEQEYAVECLEKRTSRRVSFAPANDVLLFSKDVKSTSPVRSPLQDLMTATAATTNRVQVPFTEDGIQPIMGIDTLLNAPLHTSRQRDRVNFDIGDDSGEKTMVFFTDDVFMDMTHSHTINITNGAELTANISLQDFDALTSSRERAAMKTAVSDSVDVNLCPMVTMASGSESLPGGRNEGFRKEKETLSSSLPCLDQEFENFLASLSSGPLVNPATTKVTPARASSEVKACPQIKTQMSDVDKENQVPSFASIVDKPCKTRKIGESFYTSALCTEDDASKDIPEALKGCIQASSADDYDFFQCLFPRQETFSQSEKIMSQTSEMTSKHHQSKAFGSSEPKAVTTTQKRAQMMVPEEGSQPDMISLNNSVLHASHRKHKMFQAGDDCRERTVQFTVADAAMDVTRSHTVNIATALDAQKHQNVLTLPACGEKTVRFTATDAAMDVTQSHTVNIATAFDPRKQHMKLLPTCGEKTIRFTTTDAAMDVTQSHTVNIATALDAQKHQNVLTLPACGEKTVRFTTTDAAMDVTQSHTVNIATALDAQKHQNGLTLPACGEKTVRFTATDAAMDVTQSHTVNIATAFQPESCQSAVLLPISAQKTMRFVANNAVTRRHTTNLEATRELASHQHLDLFPSCGEKTMRFTASDAAMDVTQSHTVNIATAFGSQSDQNLFPACGEKTRFSANEASGDVTNSNFTNITTNLKPVSHKNVDSVAVGGEKTLRFTASDAAMDVTQSHTVDISVDTLPACVEKTVAFISTDSMMDVTDTHTVHITNNPGLDSVNLQQDPNSISTQGDMDLPLTENKSDTKTNGLVVNAVMTSATAAVAPSSQDDVGTNDNMDRPEKQQCGVNTESKGPDFVQGTTEKPENKALTDCPDGDVSTDVTLVETRSMLRCTDDLSQRLPATDHLRKEASLSQSNEDPSSDGLEILNHPDSVDTNEAPKIANESSPVWEKTAGSPSTSDQDNDKTHSQNSRLKSLASLQSKIRRLSQMINASPDTVSDSCTVPLPQLDHDVDENATAKARSLLVDPELEIGTVNGEDRTRALRHTEGEPPSAAVTPFNLKTKQLMSSLSIGGFKPKLPLRSKPDDPQKASSAGEHTKTITVNVTNQLSDFDNDASDIYDEELGSYEDMSETLDTRSPQKISERVFSSQQFTVDEPVEDCGLEVDLISAAHGQKRPLLEDESNTEHEKRVKTSPETSFDNADAEAQSHVSEHDGYITTAPTVTTQTTDFSNSSHTASVRCEATFESTFKHSMFESQLEDYANDVQKKFDDGTVSVSEFFKLFNIDFVIHNPRQSVFPATLLLNADRTPLDLLKDRHISRRKQRVYETDVLNLTEQVEGMKMRKRDLDKPLRLVNRSLWEEMRRLSEEELKSFGVKLKERNNLFRKSSKTHSHEMKEALYSNLVLANAKEQQTLRGTIEKADEMIKSLDDCIHDLEAELAAVENKGSDGRPGLKFYQEELKKVTEALTDNERQGSELETQKKQSSNDLNRLKAETRNLEDHITTLHTVNEWKLGKKRDNCTIYKFLYDTMNLKVVYEHSNGQSAGNEPEQKISDITFEFLLDDGEAECNARLVHNLLSKYIEGESTWKKKYPTSRHVPKLLHDVSLVVSRCRLLGEELRLLRLWGSLKLDILDISSVDTQVHIAFCSLRKCAKFEVVFSVSLINQLYVLQLQSFTNKIGSTTKQQVEDIVSSFSPGRKLLTKVVKKIHEDLLC